MAELLRPNQSVFNPPTASALRKASLLPLPWVTLRLPQARGCSPRGCPKGWGQSRHIVKPSPGPASPRLSRTSSTNGAGGSLQHTRGW